VYFTGPPLVSLSDREVCVSVLFTEDIRKGEFLANLWIKGGYNVRIGGPAFGDPGGDFVPGRFVKKKALMTSRGCNNKCWFCYVWKREGVIRELPIGKGHMILDSNLLQCSEKHIRAVFAMLVQRKERAEFVGGLEAALLRDWHCELLKRIKPRKVYFAYDGPEDWEPLKSAKRKLLESGIAISRNIYFVYVLIGYPRDTMESALLRLTAVKQLGFCPFAMLYRDVEPVRPMWERLQRKWCRPALMYRKEVKEDLLFGE
ncbi:hypothetical protein KAR91_85665, partial [Candidatus Pacearchaeota archaeon]|nr:hypothetical protein [Candidatus Pacearchaeota archaeon]